MKVKIRKTKNQNLGESLEPPPPIEIRILAYHEKEIDSETHSLKLSRLTDGRYELHYVWRDTATWGVKGSEISYWDYKIVRPVIRGDKKLFEVFRLE